MIARAARPHGRAGRSWRAEALELLLARGAPVPEVAPLGLIADRGPEPGAWVCFATPVHCAATMTSVRLSPAGILSLAAAEAAALAQDFARVFHDSRRRLVAGRSGALFLVLPAPLAAATHDPGDALDQDVWDFLPSGPDAPALRSLMSEIELWLFDHEINRARESRALAPITGLWLWGGGVPLAAMPALVGWAAGGDPLFATLPLPGGDSGVVVVPDVPGTAGWHAAETQWLQPALSDLARGRVGTIQLSAGERRYRIERRWRFKVWRRPRPWWESFQ